MKLNNVKAMALAGVMMSLAGTGQAATPFSTNFDPPAYVGGATLSGQDGGTGVFWDTNNVGPGGLGQSDYVGVIPGYSTTASDYWALLGGTTGVAPVVNTSTLFRAVDMVGATAMSFKVTLGVISSQSPQTKLDTFGWSFRDSGGNSLLTLSLIPDTNQPGNLTVRLFDAANNELAGSGNFDIFYDSKYDFKLDLSATGVTSLMVTDYLGNPSTQIVNNQFAVGALPGLISDIAATWTVKDTTTNGLGERINYGSNGLVFNDLSLTPTTASVSAVPEPSSAIFGLGAVLVTGGQLLRRRRA